MERSTAESGRKLMKDSPFSGEMHRFITLGVMKLDSLMTDRENPGQVEVFRPRSGTQPVTWRTRAQNLVSHTACRGACVAGHSPSTGHASHHGKGDAGRIGGAGPGGVRQHLRPTRRCACQRTWRIPYLCCTG